MTTSHSSAGTALAEELLLAPTVAAAGEADAVDEADDDDELETADSE